MTKSAHILPTSIFAKVKINLAIVTLFRYIVVMSERQTTSPKDDEKMNKYAIYFDKGGDFLECVCFECSEVFVWQKSVIEYAISKGLIDRSASIEGVDL